MGYGAYMVVKNKSATDLTTYITHSNCVYDEGHEGSNLSIFNDASIPAGTQLPSSGSQYIEAKNSGSCFFEVSSFTIKIMTAGGTQVSIIDFTDAGSDWEYSQTPPDSNDVNVYVNNTGDQATIAITVVNAVGAAGTSSGVSQGDDAFEDPAYVAVERGDAFRKGAAGQDAQNRRNRGEDEGIDELRKKGTAGQDAQNRRNKGAEEDDELRKKGTAGQDAQNRRNKGAEEADELLAKGTAGQDAQNRRNKGAEEADELLAKGTAGQDAQNRRNKGAEEDDELRAKGTAGQDAQNRRN
ncbi:hypothetical protein [uncultured Sphingomonas sp.]|uniref:hypothetical protein n=1 Tax=uncultured Sphingomonas sp. TaxID=158754 RepID=UPI0025E91B3E|nr:hypothetical protein [uncultured Sphingomonas sp.]